MARSAASASAFGRASVSLLLLAVTASLFAGVSAWKEGRATYYGNEPWGWSIHYGSEFQSLTKMIYVGFMGPCNGW
jgi:hypothetical protein